VSEAGDREVLTWGDPLHLNLEQRLKPPLFDALGRAGAFSGTETALVHAFDVEDVAATLATLDGEEPGLEDEDDFALLAAALDEQETVNGHLTDNVAAQGQGDDGSVALRPYSAIAAGQGVDEEGLFLVIALAHENEADAAENASRLQERIAGATSQVSGQPWADLFADVEARAEGRIMVAVLRGEGARLWDQFLVQADPLLRWE
jgi:hypothetical protein